MKTQWWEPRLKLGYCTSVNTPDPHELSAFAEVLNSAEKPILVGGQAVNLWAEHFASAIPALNSLRPYMSKYAGIFGDRATAERLALATEWRLTLFNEPQAIGIEPRGC
jgi:hypothetical protein